MSWVVLGSSLFWTNVWKSEGKGWYAWMHSRVNAYADLKDTTDTFNSWYMHAESIASSLIQIPIWCKKRPENKTKTDNRIWFAAIHKCEHKCAPGGQVLLYGMMPTEHHFIIHWQKALEHTHTICVCVCVHTCPCVHTRPCHKFTPVALNTATHTQSWT